MTSEFNQAIADFRTKTQAMTNNETNQTNVTDLKNAVDQLNTKLVATYKGTDEEIQKIKQINQEIEELRKKIDTQRIAIDKIEDYKDHYDMTIYSSAAWTVLATSLTFYVLYSMNS